MLRTVMKMAIRMLPKIILVIVVDDFDLHAARVALHGTFDRIDRIAPRFLRLAADGIQARDADVDVGASRSAAADFDVRLRNSAAQGELLRQAGHQFGAREQHVVIAGLRTRNQHVDIPYIGHNPLPYIEPTVAQR